MEKIYVVHMNEDGDVSLKEFDTFDIRGRIAVPVASKIVTKWKLQ
jgi:hypothetical protein